MRMIPHAPGVQMQPIPEDAIPDDSDAEDEQENPDKRISIMAQDKRVQRDDEYSDSEAEGDGGRRDARSHKAKRSKTDDGAKDADKG